MDQQQVFEHCRQVLEKNDRGNYTVPSSQIYPHQWLWDSCFIALGLRHLDVDRAKLEIMSLVEGQWSNGMLPNMIIRHKLPKSLEIWRSWLNSDSPDHIQTSGISQPPMLAEAVVKVGVKLKTAERRSWYEKLYPVLVDYHSWLYRERDPHKEGLTLQIHPWETGLDNTPPWMAEMHQHQLPAWIQIIEKLHLAPIINLFRRDTHRIPAEQRLNIIDALMMFSAQRRIRRKRYEINQILAHSLFAIEDLTFNCILIRANQHLTEIAKFINKPLPDLLQKSMQSSPVALEELWDPYSNQYYSRNFVTHKLLKQSSIATFMPLYAGNIAKDRAEALVKLLQNKSMFGAHFPVPSVPLSSDWFKPLGYWQGPTWININWLIIDGLERNGYTEQAEALKTSTLKLVAQNGAYEYFNPQSGQPAGSPEFSWTAALTIDLLKT